MDVVNASKGSMYLSGYNSEGRQLWGIGDERDEVECIFSYGM